MHVVSGKLRKAPFIKAGCGQDGQSKMYAIELSEATKDYQSGEKSYSNYKALFFAKTPNAIQYYDQVFVEGSFVVVACEKLKIESRDHNGTTYISLVMDNPRLEGAQFIEGGQQQQPQQAQYQQQPQQPQRAPQGQQPQYAPAGQLQPQPPMDYQDDIPF